MAKEEIKVEDVLGFIGIAGDDLDALKTSFNEKYVPTETHNKTLGEVNGKVTHSLKKQFKGIGIELTSDEVKDVHTVDLPELYAAKAKAKFDAFESDKNLTNEQLETKYGDDIKKYKQQLADLNELNTGLKTEYDTFKTQVETDKKNFDVNTRLENAKSTLKFSDQSSEFEKIGFFTSIESGFDMTVEDGKEIVRKDGHIVMSKTNAGTSADFKEVLTEEFKATKLGAVADTKKVRTFTASAGATPPNGGETVKRETAPRH